MVPESPESLILPVEPPLGMYPARMDDKGRIKLPVDFQTFFAAFPEKKLFVTSLDGRIGQIYPISVWRRNQKFLSELKDNAKLVQKVLFNANDFGAEAEVDSSGRLTVNSQMREDLKLMGQELRLNAVRGRVEILSEAIYQQRRREAQEDAEANVLALEDLGMQ